MLAYCESFPDLAWLPKFPTPVVVASALFALSPSPPPLSHSLSLSASVFSPTPFLSVSLALHLQSASVVSADCWAVGEEGYREYWSFGESLWKMAPVVTG